MKLFKALLIVFALIVYAVGHGYLQTPQPRVASPQQLSSFAYGILNYYYKGITKYIINTPFNQKKIKL